MERDSWYIYPTFNHFGELFIPLCRFRFTFGIIALLTEEPVRRQITLVPTQYYNPSLLFWLGLQYNMAIL